MDQPFFLILIPMHKNDLIKVCESYKHKFTQKNNNAKKDKKYS